MSVSNNTVINRDTEPLKQHGSRSITLARSFKMLPNGILDHISSFDTIPLIICKHTKAISDAISKSNLESISERTAAIAKANSNHSHCRTHLHEEQF
jgi:hypothetical protein